MEKGIKEFNGKETREEMVIYYEEKLDDKDKEMESTNNMSDFVKGQLVKAREDNNNLKARITELLNMSNKQDKRIRELEKENKELKTNLVNTKGRIEEHYEQMRKGKLAFKSEIDMNEIIKLYLDGLSAEGIARDLTLKGIKVTRQTIINRLKLIGLWGNRETWVEVERTKEEMEYIARHNIKINI